MTVVNRPGKRWHEPNEGQAPGSFCGPGKSIPPRCRLAVLPPERFA